MTMMMAIHKRFNFFNFKISLRRWYGSALYVTGDKAQKTFAVLTPVIDFDNHTQHIHNLKHNVARRQLEIDIDQIVRRWNFFQNICERKKNLETTRSEIGKAVADLLKNEAANQEQIEKLKLHARVVKDDLKNLKETFYEIEESTVLKVLDLPNTLHEKTPENEAVVYCSPGSEIASKISENHINIAESLSYIKYINPSACYLKSEGALFEMSILNYFRQCMLKSGYIQFSNTNFCRSVILEGCGGSFDQSSLCFTLEEDSETDINRLHLCGSATVYPFMAYFTKHSIQQTNLPLKYFSLGKKYAPVNIDLPASFFNLSQQAVLNVFIATLEEVEVLDSIIKELSEFYEHLGYHFRLTLLPAHQLEKSESLRLSIQMYSNYIQSYVEVGNVSLHENYLSKRLLFTYNSNKSRKFPKIISGTLLNVPKMLGCVLENNFVKGTTLLSDVIKKHLFV